MNDPMQSAEMGKSGAVNVIDLANLDSCAFIATQDLGIAHSPTSLRSSEGSISAISEDVILW